VERCAILDPHVVLSLNWHDSCPARPIVQMRHAYRLMGLLAWLALLALAVLVWLG
jgi:hypothetical protein